MARPEAKDLRGLVHTFIRRFGLLDQSHTPCGLPIAVSDAHALMELLQAPDIEQGELAGRLGLSKSAISRLILRLKRRGQIQRIRSRDDGRAYNIKLTEKGKRMAEMIDRESLATFQMILSGISESEAEQLLNDFPLLIKAIPGPYRLLNSERMADRHCSFKEKSND